MTFSEEQNAEVLYRYGVQAVLPILKPDGIWIAPAVAPLPADKIERQLRRIADHPERKQRTIVFFSNDRKTVTLDPDGVHVTDDPDHDNRPRDFIG